MALRDRRINIFFDLWCLVDSRGADICVSSTSFQKNDISWPQQAPTEKVLKFNIIFHDSTQKIFFSKHKNKAEFKCLHDSKVLSSDFQALKPLQPQWPQLPQQPQTGKMLKFNMIFQDSTPKNFFSKHKNKTEFKCLDDFEVLSSDFSGLKTSAASVASAASLTSMTSTASFHQKIYWS